MKYRLLIKNYIVTYYSKIKLNKSNKTLRHKIRFKCKNEFCGGEFLLIYF